MDTLLCTIETLKSRIEAIQEDEQEKYDNMPEHLQELENGCRMYEGIEALEDIASRLDSLIDELSDISCDTMMVTEI